MVLDLDMSKPTLGPTEDDPIPHGTTNGYANWKCNCWRCSEVWRRYHSHGVTRRQVILAENPDAAEHGKVNTYRNWGCRCEECKVANRDYSRKYHAARRAKRKANDPYAHLDPVSRGIQAMIDRDERIEQERLRRAQGPA